MTENKHPGLLISFDGTDSSGKHTQANTLTNKLKSFGHVVERFETPDYATPSGQKLKALFQGVDGYWDDLNWRDQMELLAANRAEHRQEVLSILDQGGVVIYDRYVPSSLAHMVVDALPGDQADQGRQDIHNQVMEHEYQINNMPKENLSLFLDVPPIVAKQLLSSRKHKHADPDEATDEIGLQTRIYQEYQWLTKNNPGHYHHITCLDNQEQLRSIEDIARDVWSAITDRFPHLANHSG